MVRPPAPSFFAAHSEAVLGLPTGEAGLRPQTARTERANGRLRDLFGNSP
jgi:hypothetical protein